LALRLPKISESATDQHIETKFRIRTAYYAAAVKPGSYGFSVHLGLKSTFGEIGF